MARYVVLGATGFLGSHVVRELREDGHEIVAASRGGGAVHGFPVERVDILDRERVREIARGSDGAFLTAGKVSRDPADSEALHRDNVQGTRAALAGLREAGIGRVVYASTSGTIAISRAPEILDESAPAPVEFIARFPYYRSKYHAELEALEANAPPDFEVVIVNPSLLLGPGDLRGSSTGDVRKFLEGELLASPRGGLAFVDVRDAARAMISAFEKGRAGERYLVSAANLSVSAFLDRLERITGVPGPRLSLPRSRTLAVEATRLFASAMKAVGGESPVDPVTVEMGQLHWYCDATKAITELGFAPRDPAETLRDTVSDLVSRGVAFPRGGRYERGVTPAVGSEST
jgi:dihydroflavonol-4-reductase